MSSWPELKKELDRINEFFRPLMLLKQIPDAVQAAEVEQVRLRNVIKQRETAIAELNNLIAVKKKELNGVEEKYKKAWSEKAIAIENDAAAKEKEAKDRLQAITGQIAAENKRFKELQDRIEFETKQHAEKKAQVEAEITAKQQEMESLSEALSKILKKK